MEGQEDKETIIEEAKVELASILDDIENNKLVIGEELYKSYRESRVVGKCKCGKNLILIDSPRGSTFVGCSAYPDCKSTYSMPRGATVLKVTCEECGLPMISFGKPRQRACLDPKCGKDEREPTNEVVGVCPECESDLIKRSGRYGEFIGCSGFPKCRYTKSLDEEEGGKTAPSNKTAKKGKYTAAKSIPRGQTKKLLLSDLQPKKLLLSDLQPKKLQTRLRSKKPPQKNLEKQPKK